MIVLINESTKDIIIGELTCPMETYWHETKTKKYHDLASRIAENGSTVRSFAFEVRYRGPVVIKVIAQIPHCIGTSEEDC
jgi:hypothetical protein